MEIFYRNLARHFGRGGTGRKGGAENGGSIQGGAVLAVPAGHGRLRMVGPFTAGTGLAGGADVPPGKVRRDGTAGGRAPRGGMPKI